MGLYCIQNLDKIAFHSLGTHIFVASIPLLWLPIKNPTWEVF